MLSLHKGAKVVMSLCIARYPVRYVEPAHIKAFRKWRQDSLTISDGLAYMKTPGHFLPSIEERMRASRTHDSTPSEQGTNLHVSEIDQLLASEGIPGLDNDTLGSNQSDTESKQQSTRDDQINEHETMLWLIVKYKSAPAVWTFPFTHRRESDSTAITLDNLTRKQLGLKLYIPSFAPIAFRKLSKSVPSSRIFYYRGMFVANSHELTLNDDSDIVDFRWANRADLGKYLTIGTWVKIRDSLAIE